MYNAYRFIYSYIFRKAALYALDGTGCFASIMQIGAIGVADAFIQCWPEFAPLAKGHMRLKEAFS
jgi:hypothetical protein